MKTHSSWAQRQLSILRRLICVRILVLFTAAPGFFVAAAGSRTSNHVVDDVIIGPLCVGM